MIASVDVHAKNFQIEGFSYPTNSTVINRHYDMTKLQLAGKTDGQVFPDLRVELKCENICMCTYYFS